MVRELRGRTDHSPITERIETKEEMVVPVSTEMAGLTPVGNITLLTEVVETLHAIDGEVVVATVVESTIRVLLAEKIAEGAKGASEETKRKINRVATDQIAAETLIEPQPPPVVTERAARTGRRMVKVPIGGARHLEVHHHPEM